MRILFIGRYNESSILNGPEKVAKRIFNECSASFETCFVTYFFDGKKYGIFKKLFGSEIISLSNDQKVKRLGILNILIFLFRYKPDIIHVITFERFAVVALFYKIFSHTKLFYTVHGIAVHENSQNKNATAFTKWKDKYCESKYLSHSDKLIFLSKNSIELTKKYYRLDKNKIVIIPNGIDSVFHDISRHKKHDENLYLKCVFIGDIDSSYKGYLFLTDALRSISFKMELYIISDTQNHETENSENINFVFKDRMNADDLAKFYIDKDIFISASKYEQFSIAAVEAMAAGLVPAVTCETGMSGYIEDGRNGFTFKYGQKEKLTKILTILNSDRSKLKHVSVEAKNIFNRLNWPQVFERYKSLY
ncbi:MAG: glycosyltransferase family 4 protein [Ignavibacteria bacterium]